MFSGWEVGVAREMGWGYGCGCLGGGGRVRGFLCGEGLGGGVGLLWGL